MATKKILGLDLGTNSIGWAMVNEDQDGFNSSIEKIGVRTIHYDNFVNSESGKDCMNPEKDFMGGKSISCNAKRTQLRSARRTLQRFKKRREVLLYYLKQYGIISDETILTEIGNKTTFETIRLRSKAATEEISLEQFARVLLMINKKRGYKSSRKIKSSDEGDLIDGMAIAKKMYTENLTPGAINYAVLKSGKKELPAYYQSDLLAEFDKIWNIQQKYHPELTAELRDKVKGVNKKATYAILAEPWHLVGEKRTTKGLDLKIENALWRKNAVTEQLSLEQLIVVLQDINSNITSSSGYLGAIGDRSKQLFFNNQTVGQYQYEQISKDSHYSLKNEVFYRQDYLDEFERVWETQALFHKELTPELKQHIRNEAIFFQRPLKSKKGELAVCELEGKQVTRIIDGKEKQITIGPKVCAASAPLFQEYRIWGVVNNIKVKDGNAERLLTNEEREILFNHLNWHYSVTIPEANKILGAKISNYKGNLKGNTTQAALLEIIPNIKEIEAYRTDVCRTDKEDDNERGQKLIQLWHLLYSYEGDKSISGIDSLLAILQSERFGFDEETALKLANLTLEDGYSSLSSRAIRKIMPYLRNGLIYSDACEKAGYKHSKRSLTKEELSQKQYVDSLSLVPKNSLRNPVVEKILNQMINVVNQVVATYGKPDEIRIEMARELKKCAQERKEMSDNIGRAEVENNRVKTILEKEFGIQHVTRNDIIRYRLYEELKNNGYKTLYSNTYIPREKVFSKEFDIEHIIPQASIFDDSFSNKTLEARDVNIRKGKMTAYDFIKEAYGETQLGNYKACVESLVASEAISKTKGKKLLMTESEIPSGFIDRDLRDSQYIARKAREILEQMVPIVVATTGSVTDRLREDWQLVDIMKELNWNKYEAIGQTQYRQDRDGRQIKEIVNWSKRNDNRHHAMDALTIAFTRLAYIQYLNNLNARIEKSLDDYIDLDMVNLTDIPKDKRSAVVYAIEHKFLERHDGKMRFKAPMELSQFRQEAKQQLESLLISVKAKNKVTTSNTYKIQGKDKSYQTLTPRGSLHNDTIYGCMKQEVVKEEKIGASFKEEKIQMVCNPLYRTLLLSRLSANGNDPKKAFTGRNALSKQPIIIDDKGNTMPEVVKTKAMQTQYTIRKPISPDLKIEKVVHPKVKEVLETRLAEYNGDAKAAFSNLDENPIWLNKEAGIQIKRVTITGVSNATALHKKRDNQGKAIIGTNGYPIDSDFVSTSNNHHVAIFEDADGNLQEHVVSFYEATINSNAHLPIIDKTYNQHLGWRFLFTMKQNEMFVFPNPKTGFDPNEIDLMDENNYALISPNLYRVQKLAAKDYFFRHHLETSVEDKKELNGIAYKRLGLNGIRGIVKVRINHIGKIVSVGEY